MTASLKDVFEATTRRQLEIAYAATEGRPQVKDIWIYMAIPEGAGFGLAKVLFGDGAKVDQAYFLDTMIHPPVGSTDNVWQRAISTPVTEEYQKLVEAYKASGEATPTRIVVHYDIATQSMDADFSYNTLDPDTDYPTAIFDKWLENAKATGDFSADATTVPR